MGIALFASAGRKFIAQKECGFDLPRIKRSAGRPNPLPPAFGLHGLVLLYGRKSCLKTKKLDKRIPHRSSGLHKNFFPTNFNIDPLHIVLGIPARVTCNEN